MSFDSPFVEYLIIGTHTSSWILLMVMAAFRVPLSKLGSIDAASFLLLLPFIYLIGMLTDSTVYYPLEPFRKKIRDSVINYENYKDEFIAFSSPELYSAYDVRVRRVRIMGAAIFNWLFLGIALLLHIGFTQVYQSVLVITLTLLLSLLSIITWRGLYHRAYKFRKNACDVIRSGVEKPKGKTSGK